MELSNSWSLLNLLQLSMDLQLFFAAIILTTEDSWLSGDLYVTIVGVR